VLEFSKANLVSRHIPFFLLFAAATGCRENQRRANNGDQEQQMAQGCEQS